MSYSYSFVPNNVYGADDINEITKRLVTKGVEDTFEDGVPYNFSHINTVSKNISTLGVIPENNTSLMVTNNGKVNDEYTITIAEGTAFFEDGSTITVYDGGETLPFVYGQKNYVYLHRDLNLNKNMPNVTLTKPEGDYVPLAEISENGTVTDTRVFAKGKLPGYMSDYNNAKKIEASITGKYTQIDLGGTNYKSIICFVWSPSTGRENTTISYTAMFHLMNGKLIWNVGLDGSDYRLNFDQENVLFSYAAYASNQYGPVSINDGILTIETNSTRNLDIDIFVA